MSFMYPHLSEIFRQSNEFINHIARVILLDQPNLVPIPAGFSNNYLLKKLTHQKEYWIKRSNIVRKITQDFINLFIIVIIFYVL